MSSMDTRRFVDYYSEYNKQNRLGVVEKTIMLGSAAIAVYYIYFKAGWWDLGKSIKWADSEYINTKKGSIKKLVDESNKPQPITKIDDNKDVISVFYTEAGNKGKALNLTTGIYDLSSEGGQPQYNQSFYDNISSLKVHPAHKVRIYNCIGLQGAYKDFYWSKSNNGVYNANDLGSFVKSVRSIEIVPNDKDFIPFSKFYKSVDFGGVMMYVRVGDYPTRDFFAGFGGSRIPMSNISFSSARIHPKHKIRIYDANNYQGNFIDLSAGTAYSSFNEFNNNILSIKVVSL